MSFLAAPPAPPPAAAPPAPAGAGSLTEPLTRLHARVSPGVLPAGPGGHVLLPEHLVVSCDRFTTATGPRRRGGPAEEVVGHLRTDAGQDRLLALRVAGAGPAPGAAGAAWATGLVGVRLAAAEAALHRTTDHLQHRSVQGTTTLGLPMVRALVADAAAAIAEARALADTVAALAPAGAVRAGLLHRAHRALDESGRTTLHLMGALGFLTDGPGAVLRASELLGDAYAPAPTAGEAS